MTEGTGVGSKPIEVIGDGIWVLEWLLVTTNVVGTGLGLALDLAPLRTACEQRSHAGEPPRSSKPTGVILRIWRPSTGYQEVWKRGYDKRLKCWALISNKQFTLYIMNYMICLDLASSLVPSKAQRPNSNRDSMLQGELGTELMARRHPNLTRWKEVAFMHCFVLMLLEATTHLTILPPHRALSAPTDLLTNTSIVQSCMWKLFNTIRHYAYVGGRTELRLLLQSRH